MSAYYNYTTRTPQNHLDRMIPPRALLSMPAAAAYQLKIACPPLSNVALALFGSLHHPGSYPILRKQVQTPTTIPPTDLKEHYTDKAKLILDLPGLTDDFYSSPAAHCPQTNKLAFVLDNQEFKDVHGNISHGSQIYLYNISTKQIDALFPVDAFPLSAVKPVSVIFTKEGDKLIIGKKNGEVEIWTLNSPYTQSGCFQPALATGHRPSSIESLAFSNGLIYAGSQDGILYQIDPTCNSIEYAANNHEEHICAIVFSPNGRYLATGGDDNKVFIRDTSTMKIIYTFEMKAAIKAIAFDPQNETRIAVGGGIKDPRICIFLFGPYQNRRVFEIQMKEQITTIQWPNENRMLTTHRDGSYRVIPLNLDYHAVGPIQQVNAVGGRILFSAIDGDTLSLVGGQSPNESVKFIPLPPKQKKPQRPSVLDLSNYVIR